MLLLPLNIMLTQSEVSNLRGLLDKLSVNVGSTSGKSKSSRRKRNRRARANLSLATSILPAAFVASSGSSRGNGRRRRRRARNGGIGNGAADAGSITLKRKEFMTSITISSTGTYSGVIDFYPDTNQTPFLNGLFKMFEKVVFHSIDLIYVPAVGTTKDGLIIFGWDGSGDKVTPTSRGVVAACQPVIDGPIWSPKTLHLNQKQLMSRSQYHIGTAFGVEGENPGSIKIVASGPQSSEIGELWMTYSVTLSSPRAAP